MKRKATNTFTKFEKEMMDTIAINYILAQSDGFQLGYAQAISDFVDNIIDYWEESDDKPQQSVLNTLVDLGRELAARKRTAEENIKQAKKFGYEQYYNWQFKNTDLPLGRIVPLFTQSEQKRGDEE